MFIVSQNYFPVHLSAINGFISPLIIGKFMPYAPLMLDLSGTELTAEEKELLQHPMVGGLIFFTRNYHDAEQIMQLVKAIRQVASKELLIAVDHEGGRVQRFRDDFTELPPVATLGKLYETNQEESLQLAQQHGWLMASEVKSVGIDFSFAPVLDLDYGISDVIADRAFHQHADIVSHLAAAYIEGMRNAGMAATGKHFPGHGAIKADSHIAMPVDQRKQAEIFQADIIPFTQLFAQGLDAVMPAHVIYPKIDSMPAGFSRVWLQDILRQQLNFAGAIFSDDLSMEGASVVGGYTERAEAALEAGCDMILACNHRKGAVEILDNVTIKPNTEATQRLANMKGQPLFNRSAMLDSKLWKQAVKGVTQLA